MKTIALIAVVVLTVQLATGSELKEELRPDLSKHLPSFHHSDHHKKHHGCGGGGGWGWRSLPIEEAEGIRDELYEMAEQVAKHPGNTKLISLMTRAANTISALTEPEPEREYMEKLSPEMGRDMNNRLSNLYHRLFSRF